MRALASIALLLATPATGQVPAFVDATDDAGLTFTHATEEADIGQRHMMNAGLAAGDFDRDGHLDLFVQGGLGQNARLFINDGDGTFTDRAEAWGIDLTAAEGTSVTVGDIDGDGFLDVHAGTINGRNLLFRNVGGSGFEEIGVASGTVLVSGQPFDITGAAFGDVDLDGDLDLVTANWNIFGVSGNRVFVNDGTGSFTEATGDAGLFEPDGKLWAFTPALVDLDGDRFPDLPLAADFETSRYYAGDGDGTFTRVADNGTCTDENGMGSAFADYDNDGDLDWFVTSIFDDDGVAEGTWGITGNRLYRNDGGHQFTDVTDAAGVRNGFWGWGASFGDLDHDGWLDLVLTNGFTFPNGDLYDPTFIADPSRLWMNTGDLDPGPTFVEVAAEAGLVHTAPGKGVVTFDGDNDGDLDVVITTTHGDLKYFRNETRPHPSSWMQLDLVAPAGCAPDGIGAVVHVTVGGETYRRVVFGAPSFMSQDPLRMHFGFPATPLVERIVTEWPDGTTLVMTDVPSGRLVLVRIGNLDGDSVVGGADLGRLLEAWGRCADPPAHCPADLDGDGVVGMGDLLTLLVSWG